MRYDPPVLTCLQVLRCLHFKRGILHRDISAGNVMYVENPEIPAREVVEPLIFAKYLLDERYVSRR
jgi:Fungal protein kinase